MNINSVWNKNMSSIISENVDTLIVTETKLNSSFPKAHFSIPDFHHP